MGLLGRVGVWIWSPAQTAGRRGLETSARGGKRHDLRRATNSRGVRVRERSEHPTAQQQRDKESQHGLDPHRPAACRTGVRQRQDLSRRRGTDCWTRRRREEHWERARHDSKGDELLAESLEPPPDSRSCSPRRAFKDLGRLLEGQTLDVFQRDCQPQVWIQVGERLMNQGSLVPREVLLSHRPGDPCFASGPATPLAELTSGDVGHDLEKPGPKGPRRVKAVAVANDPEQCFLDHVLSRARLPDDRQGNPSRGLPVVRDQVLKRRLVGLVHD